MGMVFLLVVVDQFHIPGVVPFKAERDAPVSPHGDRPEPFQVAFERVQSIPGNFQSLRRGGSVENGEDSLNCLQQVSPYPAPVAALIEPFQAPMLEASDQQDTL